MFEKGNKHGGKKPKNCKHQRTILLEALKRNNQTEEEFAAAIIKLAYDGNSTALTVVASRLWKQAKATMPEFELPEGSTKEETAEVLINAMMAGKIAADQANTAMSVLRGGSELTEVAELLAMVKVLEGK